MPMQAPMTQKEIFEDARKRYSEVEIAQAMTWVMMTFHEFIFFTEGAHPEIGVLWFFNFFVNPEDHASFAQSRPLGCRESSQMRVEYFTLFYIDAILAPQIVLKNPLLLDECASRNMRIALMLESDMERNMTRSQSFLTFPNWRVDGCAECGNPLATLRPLARKRKSGYEGDLSAVLDCECGHISELGYKLDYDNRDPVDDDVSETWVDPGVIVE